MWRLQQVAQILVLAMMALTLSLTAFNLIKWREGSLLSISWIAVPLLLLFILMVTWTFAILWDMRFRMWREQMTVLTERNPYAREKMNAKEVAMYKFFWLPLVESLGRTDPKLKESAQFLRSWIEKAQKDDIILQADVEKIKKDFGPK